MQLQKQLTKTVTLGREIIEMEARALDEMALRLDDDFERATEIVLAVKGRIVVVGMGKSGHIGRKIAATMASTGTSAFFVHPAEAFHGDLGMIQPNDVVLMISNSGETEELIRLLPFLEFQKNCIIAMTGKKDSTLARHATVVLDVAVDREAGISNLAPTSSTTATLVMGDALAVVLMEQRGFQPADFARFHPGGSLGRRLLTRVSDVMRKENLPICRHDASFRDLVHVINRGRLGLALVMTGDALLGIVTDGDIRRAFDSDIDYKTIQAQHIMTLDPKTALQTERFTDVEERIRAGKLSSLVVLNEEGCVVGVLQIYDLIVDELAI